jgi:predicted ATPase/class 3 adenylate cyclase
MRFCGRCGGALPVPAECPVCHFLNAVNMHFCGQCGSALPLAVAAPLHIAETAPSYSSGHGPANGWTNEAVVSSLVPTVDERKVVTILFGDISGFTSLAEKLDPEEVKGLMELTFRRLAVEVERYEGHVDKFLGDNIMVLFGAPRAHEDDPERAVRCALEMQHAMRDLSADLERTRGFELRLHIGINTGEVLAGRMGSSREHDYTVMGDAVNLAARLQNTAEAGQIVVGETTYRATSEVIDYRSRGTVPVRGKAQPVPVWEVVGVRTRRGQVRGLPGMEARMVGRDSEFATLKKAFDRVARDQMLHHLLVMGPAGIGKSRLLWEFEKYLGGLPQASHFRKGRAQPYGPGTGFRALGEIIKAQCGILDDDPRPVAAGKLHAGIAQLAQPGDLAPQPPLPLGEGEPESPPLKGEGLGEKSGEVVLVAQWLGTMLGLQATEDDADTVRSEIFWSLRWFFASLAAQAPLVLVVEDIHWADASLLEFIEYLRDTLPEHPILILTLARPSLFESTLGQAWTARARAGRAFTQFTLHPLSERHSRRVVYDLLTQEELPADFLHLVLGKAEGNPFFLEELMRMLIDTGVLVQRNGGWQVVAALEQLRIPDTVQALVGARVDDLPEGEKRVLQAASVVGRIFWGGALVEMFPQLPAGTVAATLGYLERREFIVERGAPVFAGEREYSFRNILTREVAYNSVPKARRGDEHARVAAWIEAKAGDRLAEFADSLAYHYEQSLRLGNDMMTLGEVAMGELLDKAVAYLKMAGEGALARQSMTEANAYFSRIIELLALCGRVPDDPAPGAAAAAHPLFLDVLCSHAEAQEGLGNYDMARAELDQVIEYARVDRNRPLLARALLERAGIHQQQGDFGGLESDAQEALGLFRSLSNRQGKAQARLLLGRLWSGRDNLSEAESAMVRAIGLFREMGDRLGEARAQSALAGVLHNRNDLAAARRYSEMALAAFRAAGNRREAAYSLRRLAIIASYAADLTDCMAAATEALGLFRDLGERRGEALVRLLLATVAADRRQTAEAEEQGRQALVLFRRMGDRRSEAAALRALALALAPAGRAAEAAVLYGQALDNALAIGAMGLVPQIYRGQAEVLLALGHDDDAHAMAESGAASAGGDDGFALAATYRILALTRLTQGDRAGAEAALRRSRRAVEAANYPLEAARTEWAWAYYYDATAQLDEAATARAAAESILATLRWPHDPIPPAADLLTLARHDGRSVP